jgi:hypothetical protein
MSAMDLDNRAWILPGPQSRAGLRSDGATPPFDPAMYVSQDRESHNRQAASSVR